MKQRVMTIAYVRTDDHSRAAYALVVGRGVGAFGAALATFALDVWVYLQTGSYAIFAALAVLAMLPLLLIGPIAGVLIDRLSKKSVLLTCDLVSLLAMLLAVTAHQANQLTVPLVGGVMLLLSIAECVRWPAAGAAICLLSAPSWRGRVNGVAEVCRSAAVMAGPVSGAAVLQWAGLNGILALTSATYLLVFASLSMINMSEAPAARANERSLTSFCAELAEGLRWLRNHSDLIQLLCFFAGANFAFSVYVVSQAPYVLSFSTPQVLGVCFALDGAGIVIGGLLFARWGNRIDLNRFIVTSVLLEAAIMVAWGMLRIELLLFVCALGVGMLAAMVNAASQTIWQAVVPFNFQGRVFALRSMVVSSLAPLAILLSIPMADHVFAPMLGDSPRNVAVTFYLTAIWGAGKTGALGLLVSTFAAGVVATALVLKLRGGLRLQILPERPAEQTDVKLIKGAVP